MTKHNTDTEKRGVERSSIEKVLNVVVAEQRKPITISDIASKVNLTGSSVRSCVDFLSNLGKVEIITNGKTCLVRLIENNKLPEAIPC
jgi:predicted transcriptional regulator of viral defense system